MAADSDDGKAAPLASLTPEWAKILHHRDSAVGKLWELFWGSLRITWVFVPPLALVAVSVLAFLFAAAALVVRILPGCGAVHLSFHESLSVAAGAAIMVFPAYWISAILCKILGPFLRRRPVAVARPTGAPEPGSRDPDAALKVSVSAALCEQLAKVTDAHYVKVSGVQDPVRVEPGQEWPLAPAAAGSDFDWRFKRIGIVLSGGGAKGAYQAGSMQAIYDFLAAKGALDAVEAVAGTSIGSWNSLFWLGGLLAHQANSPSPLETWWTSYSVDQLVRPAIPVLPGISTYIMSNEPWREEFRRLFHDAGAPGRDWLLWHMGGASDKRVSGPRDGYSDRIKFYLSRTDVLSGRLAFDTNNPMAVQATGGPTHDLDRGRLTTSFDQLSDAVFTSMAIPPLFPYSLITEQRGGAQLAEDGGVSDNLPIRLAASFDKLDLLFILPLNSSFNIDDPPSFLGTRLTRAMDVRQGMLERMALKHVYLFNMQYVLSRSRPPIPAFVIAPGQPLHVQTTELWRRPELRRAVFQQMYAATSQALENFFAPGRLYASCDAFRPMWQRQRYAPIAEAGYLRESIVDPGWEPGNAFDEEMRF